MSALQATARLSVHPGRLEDFKVVAARCIVSVREKDSGTLQYDWFMNEAQTEFVVRETYRDSEAALEHVANLGDLLGELLAVSDLAVEVFGVPSDELGAALASMGAQIYAPFRSV